MSKDGDGCDIERAAMERVKYGNERSALEMNI